jgi:hypothetical protein
MLRVVRAVGLTFLFYVCEEEKWKWKWEWKKGRSGFRPPAPPASVIPQQYSNGSWQGDLAAPRTTYGTPVKSPAAGRCH